MAFPLTVGLKVTVRTADWPEDKVVPPGTPLTMKAGPEAATPETVTLLLPVLVKVEVCVLSLPRATSPKLRVAGLAVSADAPGAGLDGVLAGPPDLEDMTPVQPVRPERSNSPPTARPRRVIAPLFLVRSGVPGAFVEVVFITR